MIRTLLAVLTVLLLVSGCGSTPEPTRVQTLAPAPAAALAAPPAAASPSPPAPTAALAAPAASPSPPAPTTAAAPSALSTEALLMQSMAGLVTDIDAMQAYVGEGTEAMGQAELIQGSASAAPRGSWMDGGLPRALQVSWNPGALRQSTPVADRVPAGFMAPLPDTGRIALPPGVCPAGAKPEVAFKTRGGETVTAAMFTGKDLRAISQEYFLDPPPGRGLMEYMEGLVKAGDPRLLVTSGGWNQVLWDRLEALQSPAESLMDYQIWTVSPAIEQEVVEAFLSRLSSMGLPAMVINAFKGSRTSGWLANRTPVADDMLARLEIEAVLSGSLEGTVHERRDVSIPAPNMSPVFGPQTGDGSVVWNHPTEGKIPFQVNILLDEYDDLGRAIAGTVTGESQASGYRFEIHFKADGAKEGQLFRDGVEVGKLTMTVDAETFHNYLNLETNEEEQLEKPTGGRIAFASSLDGQWEIYVINADGSGQTRLTNNRAHDYQPSWSPGGDRIAFSSQRDGNDEIYVMNADGSNPTRLTNNAASDSWPSWSLGGDRIAFTSDRDGNNEIYVMNADGSGQTRLTNNAASDYWPSWSPGGDRIAFSSQRDGANNHEIYVMNADGSGQTRLTNNAASDEFPGWSPGGDRIAFISGGQIYVMNADGSGQTRLTTDSALSSNYLSWGP